MQYGYFDDKQREYVITTPRTPLPWINYLGSEDFFTLLSNTAGGYSFYRDARLRRLTRYRYNNSPLDSEGFRIYLRDGETVWNPGCRPSGTELDSYCCRHGLGYTILEGRKNGVSARQEFLVPKGDPCLLMRVTVQNQTAAQKKLRLFPYIEFCLWDAMDDSTNFQRNYSIGEVEVKGAAIYHKTEYRERRDHYAVFWANRQPDAFDTSRDAFLGVYGSPAAPEAVSGDGCTGSMAHGWQPVAAQQFDLCLAPGEACSIIFGLGYIENPQEEKWESPGVINKTKAEAMMARYADDAAFDSAMTALREYWTGLLSRFQASTGDEKTDRMVNIWNQYQCMVTFNMSRSASYFESGMGRGMGFRDSCQDLLGFVHMIPERARERILDIAATQFPDGRAYTEICRHLGLAEDAEDGLRSIAAVEAAVLEAGWDGAWFRRAYDAFGNVVGGKECEEGQIFIEPQGMCVMAGIGKETGQAAAALKSVEERLDTKYGIVLLQPAYTRYHLELGEITSYPPGYKENAGIFCHNNPWIVCAEAELGHGDRAFEVYRRTAPAYTEEISDIHRTEPYVYSQMIAGIDAPTFGEAKNSWLTGTAAWTFLSISQAILGIRPALHGLEIDPCIPSSLKSFTVTREFRGTVYRICVENPEGVRKGVKQLYVDNVLLQGNLIPPQAPGRSTEVKVIMG